ncbi:MAG: type I restriction endonuclease subunit R, partial [Armatimonadota bacterium]
MKYYESEIEEYAIELLASQKWDYISPEEHETERESFGDVVLKAKLSNAIDRINPNISIDAKQQAIRQALNMPSQNLIDNNKAFHTLLTEGIEVEVMGADGIKGLKVHLIDFDNIANNEFLVCNQFVVMENNHHIRADVVLFVNGLPLVVIELKNPTDETATIEKAYNQLQNYKQLTPSLFYYNSILIASDGIDAKSGTISSGLSRFNTWKSSDGFKDDLNIIPQLETIIKGMLNRHTLLDLIRHFIVFEESKKEDPQTNIIYVDTIKKIAAYHQYYAVNKAIEKTIDASSDDGDRKAGVVWHTQGSGKSLSMVFYAGKVVLNLNNPTVVVITDRNDLDDQLFDTFASCKQLLRQVPVQAGNREDLKRLLKVAGGGIVFTTIQKFFPEDDALNFEMLSDRKNIIVIADEAHRSQYGFGAKIREKNGETITRYGFAKYMRDALPNASFIGFTGTPIEKEDASTPAVFGNYVDVYDILQAVNDGATVKIYYESRLAKVHLKEEAKELLDDEVASITENEESTASEKEIAPRQITPAQAQRW